MIQKFYYVMKSQEYFEKTNTPRIPWKYVLMEAFIMIFSLEIAILMGNIFNGILLPYFFWLIVRKKSSSDREKLLEFEAEGWEFSKFLRSLEQFIQTVKGQNNFW